MIFNDARGLLLMIFFGKFLLIDLFIFYSCLLTLAITYSEPYLALRTCFYFTAPNRFFGHCNFKKIEAEIGQKLRRLSLG